MKLILEDEDGTLVLCKLNVEQDGLEFINNIGGVGLAPELRAAIASTLHPYWLEAQKTPARPANIKKFRRIDYGIKEKRFTPSTDTDTD